MTDDEEAAPALPGAKGRRVPAGRRAVVDKLWRAARRQLAAHEAHLADLPRGTAASEADAKTLATLARTIRELLALEAATGGQENRSADDVSPAEGIRRVAELRKELGRRLEIIAAGDVGSVPAPASADGERG